jgi:hypothetical protein
LPLSNLIPGIFAVFLQYEVGEWLWGSAQCSFNLASQAFLIFDDPLSDLSFQE